MYLYVPGLYFVAALCCSLAAGPAAAVLLLAAVRHRVPGDTIPCCAGLDLIPVFCFPSSSKCYQVFVFNVPLGSTVACTAWLYP